MEAALNAWQTVGSAPLRDRHTRHTATSVPIPQPSTDSNALRIETRLQMGKEARGCISRHRHGKKKGVSKNAKKRERTAELKAEHAAAAMVDLCFGSPQPAPVEEPVTEVLQPPPPKRPRGIDEKRRRNAIHELYVNMGEPDASEWKGHGGTVSEIRKALRLPAGADRCIHGVLERIVDEGDDFDGGRRSGGGRHAKLSLAEAMIAADELESGVGQTQATVSVNVWRGKQDPPKPEVCRALVRKRSGRATPSTVMSRSPERYPELGLSPVNVLWTWVVRGTRDLK